MTVGPMLFAITAALGSLIPVLAVVPEVFSVRVPKQVTLHEPVVIEVHVNNELGDRLDVDLGLSNVRSFAISIMKPDGLTAAVRLLGRDGFQNGGRYRLAPGERLEKWIVLDEWTQLDQVGKYRVTIQFNGVLRTVKGNVPGVSKPLVSVVEVLPRDEEKLRATCVLLASRSLSTAGGEDAAVALSHVTDPVAVPYLVQSAEGSFFPQHQIEGLVRIGGPEARAALERLARGPNVMTADSAKSALQRIK
jgi:hypothetical protein